MLAVTSETADVETTLLCELQAVAALDPAHLDGVTAELAGETTQVTERC